MMPLTDALPKPMAPYKGSTLIAEGIARLTSRIQNIHITVGYKGAMLAQHVVERGVRTVFNTDGQSNSWWVYHTLLRLLDEPIYVLTCDNVVELDFDLLEQNYRHLGSPACMLVPVRPVKGLEGDFIFHEGQYVTSLDRQTPAEIYCSGIQILNPKRINDLTRDEGDFYSVWRQLIAQRQLMVSSEYPKKWISVDTWQQLVELNEGA